MTTKLTVSNGTEFSVTGSPTAGRYEINAGPGREDWIEIERDRDGEHCARLRIQTPWTEPISIYVRVRDKKGKNDKRIGVSGSSYSDAEANWSTNETTRVINGLRITCYIPDESNPHARVRVEVADTGNLRAEMLNRDGNEAFARGDYDGAATLYADALRKCDSGYNNRNIFSNNLRGAQDAKAKLRQEAAEAKRATEEAINEAKREAAEAKRAATREREIRERSEREAAEAKRATEEARSEIKSLERELSGKTRELEELRHQINDKEAELAGVRKRLVSTEMAGGIRLAQLERQIREEIRNREQLLERHISDLITEARGEIDLARAADNPQHRQKHLQQVVRNLIACEEFNTQGEFREAISEIRATLISFNNRDINRLITREQAQSTMARPDYKPTRDESKTSTTTHQETKQQIGKPPLRGLVEQNPTSVAGVTSFFNEYTIDGINSLLSLKLKEQGLTNTVVFAGDYNFKEEGSNIATIFDKLRLSKSDRILVPISLYDKHAVGIMFYKQASGGYLAYYIDPANEAAPLGLRQLFSSYGYELEQLTAEQQLYTNCGPEVIEEFMLYLTGDRLSQEEAIVHNSFLVEQELTTVGQEAELLPVAESKQTQGLVIPVRFSKAALSVSKVATSHYFAHIIAEQALTRPLIENQIVESAVEEDQLTAEQEVESMPDAIASKDTEYVYAINVASRESTTEVSLKLFNLANSVSEEGWLAESSEDEDAAIVATEKFSQAAKLYREALELDPSNIFYEQAFNVISLKIEGNGLFNEGVELANIAYQLQLEAESLITEEQQKEVIAMYQKVLELYQAAENIFYQGLILSQDERFASCVELVTSSIALIAEHITTLQGEYDNFLTENQGIVAVIDDTVEETIFGKVNENSKVELFNSDNDSIEEESDLLLGNVYTVEYALSF